MRKKCLIINLILLIIFLLVIVNLSNKEMFENLNNVLNLVPSNSFCDVYLGNSVELEESCNKLTKGNCAETRCCVYSGKKCVAGDVNGPTYKSGLDGKQSLPVRG
jgi:hypothetical protein